MRYALFIVGVAFTVLVGLGARSTAAPRHHSAHMPVVPSDLYCLQGRVWGYPGNCQFSTYEQCTVTASGTDAYCGINPFYAFGPDGRQSH
ncbi:DUF3551 domain-containing protein [Bradyrhizobium sp. SSUT77]|uniref:DUF3551 domain-containing protein n=1 Tax=Bradyrhizobium sp. SSUT77 TaxID=3040603 RepID=UPI0024475259|nr:DUF3551 domain-containing protein [Bradyrhizobium sp. SSUT77]MDH2348375.1 DUF3551 domain-containing protein [Bradyrhizobium sp. SSUT77]